VNFSNRKFWKFIEFIEGTKILVNNKIRLFSENKMSVRVAVRVRPFNQREIDLGCTLCVDMEGKKTILINEDGKTRDFTYDYSFWSHDEFET
jgi:hypothetical protein